MAAAFIEEVKRKGHISCLLKDVSFSLCMETGKNKVPIMFRDGAILISSPYHDESYDVTISGTEESIHSVLIGEERLRSAMKARKLTVKSTFRRILFLESLFILSKRHSN